MSSPQVESATPAPDEFLTALEEAYHQVKRMRRSIRMDDSLSSGLGLDSLAAAELLLSLERRYGIELVGVDAVTRVQSVAELHALVTELVSARTAGA
jgi:acyl carrier protein